jgi:hypothetical protein
MKKASKLLCVLLALSLVAAFGVLGCGGGDDDPPPPNSGNFTEWQYAYVDMNKYSITGAHNGIHFHAGGGSNKGGYLEIQKVYVNTSKSLSGATLVFDLTSSTMGGTGNAYMGLIDGYAYEFENANCAGVIKDIGTENGRLVLEAPAGGHKYQGNFGSPAAYSTNAAYWIFVVKTNTTDKVGIGDVRVGFVTATENIVLNFGDSVTDGAAGVVEY